MQLQGIASVSMIELIEPDTQRGDADNCEKSRAPRRLVSMNASCHYDITVQLEPQLNFLRAKAVLTLPNGRGWPRRLTLLLHHQLRVSTVESDSSLSWKQSQRRRGRQFMPTASSLVVNFAGSSRALRAKSICISYEGRITDSPNDLANTIGADWTELGLYFPWFPCRPELPWVSFSVKVKCNSRYILLGQKGDRNRRGVRQLCSSKPDRDIVLIASPNLRSLTCRSAPAVVTLYHVSLQQDIARRIASECHWIIEKESFWFGDTVPLEVSVAVAPRNNGQWYARENLIVMDGQAVRLIDADPHAWFSYVAHECAHLWWTMAKVNSGEDWLNEGLAEYSAMLILEERFGTTVLKQQLERKLARTKNLPPILSDSRSQSDHKSQQRAQRLLYDKAPVILHELHQRIGRETFMGLCRNAIKTQVRTTKSFLRLLSDEAGAGVRNWFEKRLTKFLGPPTHSIMRSRMGTDTQEPSTHRTDTPSLKPRLTSPRARLCKFKYRLLGRQISFTQEGKINVPL